MITGGLDRFPMTSIKHFIGLQFAPRVLYRVSVFLSTRFIGLQSLPHSKLCRFQISATVKTPAMDSSVTKEIVDVYNYLNAWKALRCVKGSMEIFTLAGDTPKAPLLC